VAQRQLGTTGLKTFPLGLGTVKIGRNRDLKYPRAFELPDDRQVADLLAAALDEGISFIDTAPAYGLSEERLGSFVSEHRDQILLCTKAGEDYGPEGSSFDFSAAALERSVDRSLTRLQTDHLDLLLLHSDGRDEEILNHTDALEGLRRIKTAGKARAVGLSAKTAAGIRLAAAELDAVMAPFGPGQRELESELVAARAGGCATLAIKVLGQGHAVVDASIDPVQSALDLVLQTQGIDLAVIGTVNSDHLRDAAAKARRSLGMDR
jgi:aryl-alcohol dehydrogenase-like predicted oxidoreductase